MPTEISTRTTLIAARLERLPREHFHTLIIAALGITWILGGLEATLAGSASDALTQSPALHLSDAEVGFAGTAYLLGAVVGAVGFGWLTDRLGRKRLTLFWDHASGAVLMLVAAVVAGFFAVRAEGKSLEDVATPLSASA